MGEEVRHDGYVNLLNKYGTAQDNSQAYEWQGENLMMDMDLSRYYETNGLFAKIIDEPAKEAFKHGYELGINDKTTSDFVAKELKRLHWKSKGIEAIKWARLYGGSIIVMMVDDGKGLEEPLDWNAVKRIEELRVYDRSIVSPDYTSLYHYDLNRPWQSTTPKYGMPEYYYVYSVFGHFIVHESRCLILKNGCLPERVTNSLYRFWGIPILLKIKQALRESITAHSNANKLLDRCVQAIYKMKDLAQTLEQEDGEEMVLKRLQVIDMARGLLNSLVIDAEGEDYDFKTMTLTGVDEIIDKACQMLSAITSIPQTILWGRSPAGENATGESDFENYYNMVEGDIQEDMLYDNLTTLIDGILLAGKNRGAINDIPEYNLEFNPLWSLNEKEQADVDQKKAETEKARAEAAQIYITNQVLTPDEVRNSLKKSETFTIDTVLDEDSPDLKEDWGAGLEDTPVQPAATNETSTPQTGTPEEGKQLVSDIREKWKSKGMLTGETPPGSNPVEAIKQKWLERGMLKGTAAKMEGKNLIQTVREKWLNRGFLRGNRHA